MGGTELRLQDPSNDESVYLQEAFLERCVSARSGAGAFAFASAQGVQLLLRDPVFEAFAKSKEFGLVVGVDAVTDTDALNALARAEADLPGLSVRVFATEPQEALFHPKFAWFREPDGGTLIVGSGNLTNGGLRSNWEAFTVSRLTIGEIEALRVQWEAWLDRHGPSLRGVDDELVRGRAERNRAWTAAGGRRAGAPGGGVAERAAAAVEGTTLVAEIPRAGNRWGQANFDQGTYEGFFGAKVGTQRRILLQHVSPLGALGPVENRPSVEVRSQNYRFELDAAGVMPYPRVGRPIGVFVRLRPRTFVYRLAMPGDPDYAAVEALLATQWRGRRDRMRRVQTTAAVAAAALPGSPLWAAARTAFRDVE